MLVCGRLENTMKKQNQTAKATATVTTTATAMEYRNRFGLTSFRFGEIIDTTNTGKAYLTAVNCALSIVRILRDKTQSDGISKFLNTLDSGLSYAWNNIKQDGTISCFDSNIKPFVEDAIHDCLAVLQQYNGEEFSLDIQKQVRNGYGRTFDSMTRACDTLNTIPLDELITADEDEKNEVEYQPLFTDTKPLHNRELIKAIKQCNFDNMTLDILMRRANGDKVKDIAGDYGIGYATVDRHYKKAIAQLQKILIKA